MSMHGECCEFDCQNRGAQQCQFEDWQAERRAQRAAQAKVAEATLAEAESQIKIAWAKYAQGHISSEESEDARQEAIEAECRRDQAALRLECLRD